MTLFPSDREHSNVLFPLTHAVSAVRVFSLFDGEILFIFLDILNVKSSVNTVPKFISNISTKHAAGLVTLSSV